MAIRLARGNKPHHVTAVPLTVHHDQHPQRGAKAQEDVALLADGVIGVRQQQGLLIFEDRLGLRERDAVLAKVLCGLGGVPFDMERSHTYNVCTAGRCRKAASWVRLTRGR